jgi:large subunit ribosomal protein L35
MPKLKTHKGTKKRFKISKGGKVKRGRPGRRHLLSVKTTKRKRNLRRAGTSPQGDARRIKRLLPYD